MACWRTALTPQPGCSPGPACPRWAPAPRGGTVAAGTRPSLGNSPSIFLPATEPSTAAPTATTLLPSSRAGGRAGWCKTGASRLRRGPSWRMGMAAGQDCWLAWPVRRLLRAGDDGGGRLGHDAQPAPGELPAEVEVPGALDGDAAGSRKRAADKAAVQADAAVVMRCQRDRAGMNNITMPARRYLGRAEQHQVAVYAALQLGIVVGQQPGCGVAWQPADYVGLELVDRPVVHLRPQVTEEPHGRDLVRRQQGAGAWHDQPVPQARRRVLQQLHRA